MSVLAAAVTFGERVNAWIDDLVAVGDRLVELPLVMVIGALVLLAVAVVLVTAWWTRKRGRGLLGRVVIGAVAVLTIAIGLFLIDRKISRLEDQVAALRAKSAADTTALLAQLAAQRQQPAAVTAQPTPSQMPAATMPAALPTAPTTAPAIKPVAPKIRTALFIDADAVKQALAKTFGDVTIRPLLYDAATDIYQVHTATPMSQAWLAIVDLSNPQVVLHVQGDFSTKTLTSDFARQTGSTVAINGEAGNSPGAYSGLGPWTGYMVIDGQTVREENRGNPRPFLAFDKHNHATFRAMSAQDRKLPDGQANVIWGRLDAIVNGVVQTENERYRQPRTAMGINGDGTRLYLMVVDGRQPRTSNGFTRAEVGYFLKGFGASDAMLCDEGGSSCIYLQQYGGIANVPSDFNGQERPTYTHFGVSLRKSTDD